MQDGPDPLPEGLVLAGRFEIQAVLGRGGFGIAYSAKDLKRRDTCVVKELAPTGAFRDEEGVLRLDGLGSSHASRLRQQFLQEAMTLSRLSLPGVPEVRSSFSENGTAYFVMEQIRGARTLEQEMESGPVPYAKALDLFLQALDILHGLHLNGILHRDLKPSNLLIAPNGRLFLLDFGASREWHADADVRHTILFTPAYSPPEQLSSRARRGPASDLFALCATFYHALTGHAPASPSERAAGEPLVGVRAFRSDVPKPFADALEAGMRLVYAERPQTAEALRDLLRQEAEAEDAADALEALDEKAVRLRNLRFSKKECPSCGGLLESATPLRKHVCPVCHEGTIRVRKIQENLCPVCRLSPLKHRQNLEPLAVCPACSEGLLARDRKGLLSKGFVFRCPDCEAAFEPIPGGLRLIERGAADEDDVGHEHSSDVWRERSGRAAEFWHCAGCGAQFDPKPDGRRLLRVPANVLRYTELYPDEWARVAAGLPAGAGNAECDACGADFFREGEKVTLIEARQDPYHFAQKHLGRLMDLERIRWAGAGKSSPNPGLVCHVCESEFDVEGDYLRLVQTTHIGLAKRSGQALTLEDWHRATRGLPLVAEEEEFEARMDCALVEAYENGRIGFGSADAVWKGPARRYEMTPKGWREVAGGELVIRDGEIAFGGLLRKWRVPLDAVLGVELEESSVALRVQGEPHAVAFAVDPVELAAHLESGTRKAWLAETELAARLRHELGLAEPARS